MVCRVPRTLRTSAPFVPSCGHWPLRSAEMLPWVFLFPVLWAPREVESAIRGPVGNAVPSCGVHMGGSRLDAMAVAVAMPMPMAGADGDADSDSDSRRVRTFASLAVRRACASAAACLVVRNAG